MSTISVPSGASGASAGTARTSARLGSLAGIAFALLLAIGFGIRSNTPNYSDSQAWSTFYNDSGHRIQQIIGGYLLVLAAFAFLWFQAEIGRRLRVRAAEGSILPMLISGSGLLFTAVLLVAATALISVAAGTVFGSAPVPNPELAIQFEQFGYGLLLFAGMLVAALFVTLVSVTGAGMGLLPRWLGGAGVIVGVALLFGPFFLPAMLLVLWAIGVGIVLLMQAS